MSTDTLNRRNNALGLHDGHDAAEPTSAVGSPRAKALPNRESPVNGNRFRAQAVYPASAAFAAAVDDKQGIIARRLGVKPPTVTKWTQGELAITLRDIIACGPDVMRSVASSLKTLAAAEQAKNRQARADFQTLTREMLGLFAVAGEASKRLQESADPNSPAGRGVSPGEKEEIVESLESLKTTVEQLLDLARQLPVEH